LPQAVYPFYAYSRISEDATEFVASVPSGNFGDMMGTVIAKQMGLPIKKLVIGVNENTEFPEFLNSGEYVVRPSIKSPSSAMIVSHPSNLARLIDFYGGHLYDRRDPKTKEVIQPGVIDRMPDISAMKEDMFSVGISNPLHYETMKDVYMSFGIILDPHGAVGWKSLEIYLNGHHDQPSVIYETADPGKFPEDVEKAIGIIPELPPGMKRQASLDERIYALESESEHTALGFQLSKGQVEEAKAKIRDIWKDRD
ncbi:MAG TPA: hypothetical protein PLL73_05540, partial [Syntrophorhabdaceae bacterium]|nr:hypothetical protein [Syntrophorhabdaceae bacterium]